MRNNIVNIGAGELTYEIRAIVEIADKLKSLGINTNMENIGDPVADENAAEVSATPELPSTVWIIAPASSSRSAQVASSGRRSMRKWVRSTSGCSSVWMS